MNCDGVPAARQPAKIRRHAGERGVGHIGLGAGARHLAVEVIAPVTQASVPRMPALPRKKSIR